VEGGRRRGERKGGEVHLLERTRERAHADRAAPAAESELGLLLEESGSGHGFVKGPVCKWVDNRFVYGLAL
jgi:hypothetical protein